MSDIVSIIGAIFITSLILFLINAVRMYSRPLAPAAVASTVVFYDDCKKSEKDDDGTLFPDGIASAGDEPFGGGGRDAIVVTDSLTSEDFPTEGVLAVPPTDVINDLDLSRKELFKENIYPRGNPYKNKTIFEHNTNPHT